MANISFDVIHLCQTILQCPKTTQMQCYSKGDEIIGKIEVDPKIEASVVEVFQDVLDKLSDVGKKDNLLKFFKLVQDGKFPLNNITFELFLDIELMANFSFDVIHLCQTILQCPKTTQM
jgi:hypothetical protein